MKYIDADKLIAEIERRRGEAEKIFNHIFEYASSAKEISEWVSREYNSILSCIDSLQQEQPEVELEKAARHVYESWMGGTMDDVRRDMVELGKVLNARKED